MNNDPTNIIIDKLETFAEENNLKYLYSLERRPEGCLIVYFGSRTEDEKTQGSYRISYSERTQNSPYEIVNNIIEKVKNTFKLK